MSKKRLNLKKFIPFCIVVIAIIVALIFFIAKNFGGSKVCVHNYVEGVCTKCGAADPDYVPPVPEDEIHNLTIACGGDVMYHLSQLKSDYNFDDKYQFGENDLTAYGTFNFNDEYQYIKNYVQAADIAFANLETTFAGGPDYSGSWARFNTPDALAGTLKDVGFDVMFTSNNHSLDRKIAGLQRTIDVLESAGLKSVGSRRGTADNRSIIVEKNGIKIGLVSYTYETAELNGRRTLNGSPMEEGAWNYLNTFRYVGSGRKTATAKEEDKEAIANEISWCREHGADIVISYFHWDAQNEYVLEVTKLQEDLAQYAAEKGADIIFGSHPHRVQRIDEIEVTRADGRTHKVPVYYSLGNFISNQRYESLTPYGDPEDQARATEQELLAYLDITYNKTKDEITFNKISAIPLWVDRYKAGTYYDYRIIPLVEGFEEIVELQNSGHLSRAQQGLKNLEEIIGKEYIY